MIDPYSLIGKEVPAADGGDYGHLVVGFHAPSNDFKASVRYQLDKAR